VTPGPWGLACAARIPLSFRAARSRLQGPGRPLQGPYGFWKPN